MSAYEINPGECSAMWVAIEPDENDQAGWELIGHISDYLWTTFGLELDCEAVAIGMVYDLDAGDGTEFPVTARREQVA